MTRDKAIEIIQLLCVEPALNKRWLPADLANGGGTSPEMLKAQQERDEIKTAWKLLSRLQRELFE